MTEREIGARHAPGSEVELPELVRAYLDRALPGERAAPQHVRIRQEGEMWQRPASRPMRFSAVQRFAVDRVAFSWRARFPIVGPIAIRVNDEYAERDGRLEVRALGLPLKRQRSPEIVTGEALRYLAELPWVPYAMAHNRQLEWRQLDERHVEVATHVGEERLAVEMEFDDAGDIVRSSSQMRLFQVETSWVPTPWAGEFRDYKLLGGIRIPTQAEVYWDLESGRFVYWRGTVTSAELLDLKGGIA